MSTSSAWGTGKREYFNSASTTCSASWPAARAFHKARLVMRYVCTCSGERSSSVNGAIARRHSTASGWLTSSKSVLSDWTVNGPSAIDGLILNEFCDPGDPVDRERPHLVTHVVERSQVTATDGHRL